MARVGGRLGWAALLAWMALIHATPGIAEVRPLQRIAQVGAGAFHACALTTGGGVKCWGNNGSGQLGDNSATNRPIPVDVIGLASGVTSIAVGGGFSGEHTCALTSAGAVKCWGSNSYGQLGAVDFSPLGPLDVSGLSSGVAAIAAGSSHSCALTQSGGVKCWGRNNAGQLGDGTTVDRMTPVDVSGLSGVTAIAAGGEHTCAVTGGGVKCWGRNDSGQLGDDSTSMRSTPVDVVGLASGVAAISAGGTGDFYGHSCALTQAGAVKCWGSNRWGQLGDDSTLDRLTPVDVSGLSGGVAAIDTGFRHACALTQAGAVKCWGENSTGQLGDGSTEHRRTPVDVIAPAIAIAAGNGHSCAVTGAGEVKCWGANASGQLGDNTTTQRFTPAGVTGLSSGTNAVTAGFLHSCAVTAAGTGKCWGDNTYGQLGDGSLRSRNTPGDVAGVPSPLARISAGEYHTCAVTGAGGAMCWGNNGNGQLGDGSTTMRLAPVDVTGLASGVGALAAGGYHTCAVMLGGSVKCWGDNSSGQLGDGSTTFHPTPEDVPAASSGMSAVAAGSAHTCALTQAGGVRCWGRNDNGQLGDGTTTGRLAPVNVAGLSSGVGAIAAGFSHTCALTLSGAVKCWGANGSGELGDGSGVDRLTP